CARLRRDQVPAMLHAVVVAERVGHVPGLAAVPHDAVLVQDLGAFGKAHRAPDAVAGPELMADRGELPVAQEVVEIPFVRLVRGLHLVTGARARACAAAGTAIAVSAASSTVWRMGPHA